MNKIQTSTYPRLKELLRSLGRNDVQRAEVLGVGTKKTVERLRERLPSQMAPFVKSKVAISMLEALIADLKEQST